MHNDCQILSLIFSPPEVTTPRDKVLILKHLQLFPIIIVVAFSSRCCLTSSRACRNTTTISTKRQHHLRIASSHKRTHSHLARLLDGEYFVFPSKSRRFSVVPPIAVFGCQKFRHHFRNAAQVIKILKFAAENFKFSFLFRRWTIPFDRNTSPQNINGVEMMFRQPLEDLTSFQD